MLTFEEIAGATVAMFRVDIVVPQQIAPQRLKEEIKIRPGIPIKN